MKWRKSPEELVTTFESVMPAAPAVMRNMFGFPAGFIHGNMFMGLHQENMILRLSEGTDFRRFEIDHIEPGSAAAAAGLQKGDVITAIDGHPASDFDLDKVETAFRQSGRTVHLTIDRSGKALKCESEAGRAHLMRHSRKASNRVEAAKQPSWPSSAKTTKNPRFAKMTERCNFYPPR